MKLNFKKIDDKLVPVIADDNQRGKLIEDVLKCTVSTSEQETIMTLTVSVEKQKLNNKKQ